MLKRIGGVALAAALLVIAATPAAAASTRTDQYEAIVHWVRTDAANGFTWSGGMALFGDFNGTLGILASELVSVPHTCADGSPGSIEGEGRMQHDLTTRIAPSLNSASAIGTASFDHFWVDSCDGDGSSSNSTTGTQSFELRFTAVGKSSVVRDGTTRRIIQPATATLSFGGQPVTVTSAEIGRVIRRS